MRDDRDGKGREIQDKLEGRIREMEQGDSPFPKPLGRGDYIAVAAVAAVCLLLLAAGARL